MASDKASKNGVKCELSEEFDPPDDNSLKTKLDNKFSLELVRSKHDKGQS